jgi:hypothetical protein
MPESEPSTLVGPERILCRCRSRLGPFARRSLCVSLPPTQFTLINSGPTRYDLVSVFIDPLSRTQDGSVVTASLKVSMTDPRQMSLPPGGSATVELSGQVPAQPGAYVTAVRCLGDGGLGLAIPVAIEVAASPVWGIGAMLLGLMSLGIGNFFAAEGETQQRLGEALAARQEIHAALESNPPPQSRAGDIEAMDRDFDAAILVLGQRRGLSYIDHRATEAVGRLKAAEAVANQLRHDASGQPRGAGEVLDIERDDEDLQKVLGRLETLSRPASIAEGQDLAGRLDAFLLRYRSRFLQAPVAWIREEAASEAVRVRLAFAAGEGDTAREIAFNTRRWLRRSARSLNGALAGYRGALVLSGSMVANDQALRARLMRPDFPADARGRIDTMLDAAAATLTDTAWLPEWASAHRQIDEARTLFTRAYTGWIEQRLSDGIAKVDAATNTDDIDRLVENLQAAPDHSLAAKRAGLTQVLSLWRGHVAGVVEPAERDKLAVLLDRLTPIVSDGDLTATGPIYRELTDAWAAWNIRLVQQIRDGLDHQRCLDLFADLQRDTGAIEASLRERPAGAEVQQWDQRLDLIRLEMQRRGPDAETVNPDCVGPLLALDKKSIDLSGDILAATIADLEVPVTTRLRLAEASGLAGAVEATQTQARIRDLKLTIATPADERQVGRAITLSVERMDPVWGTGVSIHVDFGDGSAPFAATAEQLRQGRLISHDYATPATRHLSVTSLEDAATDSGDPAEAVLGEGSATILVAPSPVSLAERLADDFLTLRFGFALLIALVVYYWRFQSRTAIFGAKSFDYVEAFALGFVANGAALKLPDVLEKLTS